MGGGEGRGKVEEISPKRSSPTPLTKVSVHVEIYPLTFSFQDNLEA